MEYYNINKIYDDVNRINENQKEKKDKIELKDENEELDDQYNILFDSTVDISSLKLLSQNTMTSSDFSLEKNLTQSKRNILIVNEDKDFLENRKWNYLDKKQIKIINDKIKLIYKDMNKKQLKILKEKISKCNLEHLYKDFNPREVINRIGTLSSLDFLIETTYHSQPNNINNMFSDKPKLQKYIYKFRSILGDVDCFYRSIIFSFLENIILSNNLTLMKELLLLFVQKINKKNPLIKQKEYLKNIEKVNIDLVTQILYVLLECMENKYKDTYNVLLKVFLYCMDFDNGIIYFTRYLLFEYISSNENKIFSKQTQLDVGCLLPEEYIIDKGDKNEYLFENFYSLQLMKPKTYAEKIILDITPFVFNCNINILIYDYGANAYIEEKKFECQTDAIFQLNLLFRKSHYDIYYKEDFYKKFSNKLDCLKNILENICFLNAKNPEQLIKKYKNNEKNDIIGENNNININQNKNIKESNNNNIKGSIDKNNNENNNDKKNIESLKEVKKHENYEQIFAQQFYDNKDNSPKCLQCKKPFVGKENPFGLCNDCLLNDLNSEILQKYLVYLQKRDEYPNEEKLQEFFKNQKCTISIQQDIPLLDAISNSGYKWKDLLCEIRKSICLICTCNIEKDKFYIELPCQCRICKKECFQQYINSIYKKLSIIRDNYGQMGFYSLNCFCGFKYNLQALIH